MADAAAGGVLALVAWRFVRYFGYRFIGIWRPGWRRAMPYLRALERYGDLGTSNVLVYPHDAFAENIDALEREMKRIRRGGEVRPFSVPHDFPPGTHLRMRADLGPGPED